MTTPSGWTMLPDRSSSAGKGGLISRLVPATLAAALVVGVVAVALVADTRASLADTQEELLVALRDLTDTRGELSAARADIATVSDGLDEAKASLESTDAELAANARTGEAATEAALDLLTLDGDSMKEGLVRLQANLSTASGDLNNLNGESAVMASKFDTLSNGVRVGSEDLLKLRDDMTGHQAEYSDLKDSFLLTRDDVDENEQAMSEIRADILGLQDNMLGLQNSMLGLQDSMTAVAGQITVARGYTQVAAALMTKAAVVDLYRAGIYTEAQFNAQYDKWEDLVGRAVSACGDAELETAWQARSVYNSDEDSYARNADFHLLLYDRLVDLFPS